jgi:hypothetical protein
MNDYFHAHMFVRIATYAVIISSFRKLPNKHAYHVERFFFADITRQGTWLIRFCNKQSL